jgi:YjbE family integral membrane protein
MSESFMETAVSVAFWVALAKIIWVNILLSGDNAVVIALAARSLPPKQQKKAVIFGSAAAIVLRVVLTLFAVQLLQYPYLKLVGAVLLLWIGIQLLVPEDEDGEDAVASSDNIWTAIRTILIADLVMSLDNVIAVAAAAESGPPNGKLVLLLIGLGLSIPLIIVGSQLLLRLMDRWPIIITAGAGLLGFVAGEMAVSDPVVEEWTHGGLEQYGLIVAFLGAAFVIVAGTFLARRKRPGASRTEQERP